VGVPLLRVAVEEALVAGPRVDQRDLPAEVHGVAEAGVEALPQKGRRLVCGIAGQEDAAFAPAVGRGSVKLVDR
jgi:hypothetical protein